MRWIDFKDIGQENAQILWIDFIDIGQENAQIMFTHVSFT